MAIDLKRLAYQHIGISPGIELDKVRKRYIGPAAEELESVGYLKNLNHDQRFSKVRQGVWTAAVEFSGSGAEKRHQEPAERDVKLLQAMTTRGISTVTALQVISGTKREEVVQAIKAMDEQKQRGVTIRSADKWLSKAIQAGFQPSPEFRRSELRPERKIFRKK